MIQSQEVRIGNLVEYDKRIFEIHSIAEVFPTLNTEEFGIGVVDWNNIKPIVLTKEWLLKLGWEEKKGTAKGIGEFNWFEKGGYSTCHIGQGLIGIQDIDHKPVMHVHQFQNLYFSLTGEELKQI